MFRTFPRHAKTAGKRAKATSHFVPQKPGPDVRTQLDALRFRSPSPVIRCWMPGTLVRRALPQPRPATTRVGQSPAPSVPYILLRADQIGGAV
jgi:hypothetical protein